MYKEKVFIVLKEKAILDIEDYIYVKDIGKVYCLEEQIKLSVENIEIYNSPSIETWDLIDPTHVAEKIMGSVSNIDLSFHGASDILLEIKSREKENKIIEFLKVIFVSATLFFGAGLGIMYFHEDVNMINAMEKLYFSFTGINVENPLIMSIPYCIGIGLGAITFSSRIKSSSKRRRMEPDPMDIELYLYNTDMEDYIMNELSKKKTGS
ncbi:MAG: stage V sporulation protein AA [Tissierellia bacterium]|nr:stage V sporulation protein AA [Tissierellia bacterium]MDD4726993.1 stage V sporulation protein AA [Tissierellia bacterium]